MFNISEIGARKIDKLFAEKFDVSDKTIRNYRTSNKDNVILPNGKIHIFKAMYLYMYLTELGTYKNEDGEIESELYSNAELLMQSIDSLESNISLLKENLQADIKEAVNSSIQRDIDTIKEITKELI